MHRSNIFVREPLQCLCCFKFGSWQTRSPKWQRLYDLNTHVTYNMIDGRRWIHAESFDSYSSELKIFWSIQFIERQSSPFVSLRVLASMFSALSLICPGFALHVATTYCVMAIQTRLIYISSKVKRSRG